MNFDTRNKAYISPPRIAVREEEETSENRKIAEFDVVCLLKSNLSMGLSPSSSLPRVCFNMKAKGEILGRYFR